MPIGWAFLLVGASRAHVAVTLAVSALFLTTTLAWIVGEDAGPTCFGLEGEPIVPFPANIEPVDGYCDEGVAERVLLPEERGVAAGGGEVPGAPLVDDHADALLRVVLVHDRAVLLD